MLGTPDPDGRGNVDFILIWVAITLLLVGIAAAAAVAVNWPPDTIEEAAAGCCAAMGLVFGVSFVGMAMPGRWDADGRVYRRLGWLAPLSVVSFAVLLLSAPGRVAQQSARVSSSAIAVAIGLGMLLFALQLGRAWFAAVRSYRP